MGLVLETTLLPELMLSPLFLLEVGVAFRILGELISLTFDVDDLGLSFCTIFWLFGVVVPDLVGMESLELAAEGLGPRFWVLCRPFGVLVPLFVELEAMMLGGGVFCLSFCALC